MSWTQHVIGEPDLEQQVQRCVLCGLIIIDHRDIMYPTSQGPPPWWTEGPIYVKGGTMMLGNPENYTSCT